jgi:PAS domain S-box-containing protein
MKTLEKINKTAGALLDALSHQQRLQEAFVHLVGFSMIGLDGRYETINNAYAATCGYTSAEMVGMQWTNTVHPESVADGLSAYDDMIATGETTLPLRGVRKDGTEFQKRVTILTRFDGNGVMDGHYCLMIETPGKLS